MKKEERLKILNVVKTNVTNGAIGSLKGLTELVASSSFMGGVYMFVEGINGRAVLSDSPLVNFVFGGISFAFSYLATTVVYDLNYRIENGKFEDEEDIVDENSKGAK